MLGLDFSKTKNTKKSEFNRFYSKIGKTYRKSADWTKVLVKSTEKLSCKNNTGLHHIRFSSNPNLKVRKTRFLLYLSIDNFANFYYCLNMRKQSKRATFQLSISLFICIILIFLTRDIADWKKIAGFAMTDIWREKMMGSYHFCKKKHCRFRNDRYMAGKMIGSYYFFPPYIGHSETCKFFFSICDISG